MPFAAPENSIDVFAGGGAMRALMRKTDWAATTLGPVQSWPQSLIAAVLAACGSIVSVASSVEEAMGAFESAPTDVILSDIGMPEADGYELIRRIRARPRSAGGATPGACLTGYTTSEDRRRALLAGFTMHLSKPIDPAELVAVVASLARMAAALGG